MDTTVAAYTHSDYVRAAQLQSMYQQFDFVDTIIMAMSERLKITRVLTFDRRHFGVF